MFIVFTLLLILAYVGSGYLAMQISGLYGNVLAIFPPAGIALGAWIIWERRAAPAIVIGAFSIVVLVFLKNETFDWKIVSTVGSITAIGAVVQAWFGTFLIKRFVAQPKCLLEFRDIVLFYLLGGPASCVVNATVGVSILVGAGNIEPMNAPSSWLTWWMADAIGVFIFAPMMVGLFSDRRQVWKGRFTQFLLPMLILLVGVSVFFAQMVAWDTEKNRHQISDDAQAVANRLSDRLDIYTNTLVGVERLYASSSNVDRDEFARFVEPILQKYKGIQAFEWLPQIRDADRVRFEQSARAQGFPQFTIFERNDGGNAVPAQQRELYFPVYYVEPYVNNEKALGFDVASTPSRRSALERARDTGELVATQKIKLVQERGTQNGLLVIYPFYRGGTRPDTIAARRDNLVGYVVAAFRIGDVLSSSLRDYAHDLMTIRVYDQTDVSTNDLIHEELATGATATAFQYSTTINIAGRTWRIEFQPTMQYLSDHRSWIPWGILAVGLIIISIIGAFLLTISGRQQLVEQLVERRTLELSAILNGAGDAIISFDENGLIESANPQAEQLFEIGQTRFVGHSLVDVIPVNNLDSSRLSVGDAIFEAFKSAREFTMLNKEGNIVRCEMNINRIDLSNRRLYVAIVRDLSERDKVDRVKGEFVSIVSHELRTPLTAINGVLSLLKNGVIEPGTPEMSVMIDTAIKNTDRLTMLINDILDFEKLESGKMQFDLAPHSVRALLADVKSMNDAYAIKYNVKLVLDLAPNDCTINVDRFRFHQVLANLISNAAKFSNPGSDVRVSMQIRDDQVRIAVRDYGAGIPPEFYSKIFSKFAQANSSDTRSKGGTGLGLSITKSLIDAMGGQIGFTSKVNEGSEFFLYFQINRDA